MEILFDAVVPFIVFTSLVISLALVLRYKRQNKSDLLRSIEAIAKETQALTPDVIKELARQHLSSGSDLKKGVLLIAVAMGIWGFSFFADFPQRGNLDLNDGLYGLGCFPFLVGLGFLLLHRLEKA